MHLAIKYNDTNVTGVAVGQRSMFHAVHNTLQDSRHEACVNGTTNNRVDEYELATPLQINDFFTLDIHLELLITKLIVHGIRHAFSVRLYNQVYFAKLTGTTTLFLMAIFSLRALGNRFKIGRAHV